jgi:UDPglucose 6-dehydrogenase
VRLYDPQVPASAAAHPYAHAATSAEDALAGADALLVMTPWPAFRHTDCSKMRGRTIIDPYGVMQPRTGFSHFRIGARA